ncbi:hypothetical protein B0A68_11470 [Flavobacterium reichenbachii]|uniref:Uncharacterized protein n=1 Tax=Flavobacterium reichenbachii TaxID=362418 RepID=A0A085ZNU6_9FLAO|nr:hypothetical protein IW19_11475 [Flavobacterium reichenbachii]OXB14798.1 hypothetical protein B0A68_11470 [Flavobacterium reichenbachii]
MYKWVFSVLFILLSISGAHAQTGIGTLTPDASAALDISSTTKGLLVPKVTTDQKNAIPTPAAGLMVFDTEENCISVNNGTPDVPKWESALLVNRKSFYMPSINIETSNTLVGQTRTKDLYGQYASEFGSPKMASDGAPAGIPFFGNAKDLHYYITYYDETLIQIISLDENGLLTYKILKPANFDSYINIVFMPK